MAAKAMKDAKLIALEDKRRLIEKEYEDFEASYVAIASMMFTERVDNERLRVWGFEMPATNSVLDEQRALEGITEGGERARVPC